MGIKFQTDQSGANNNVCSTTSEIFNFSLARSNTLEVADFSIKKGSGTTASIIVTVYDQPNGAGNVVESVTVLASNVTQIFSTIVFTFAGTTTLNAGTSYSLKISSTTSCVGNAPYSIKVGNFQIIDTTNGGVINTGYGIGSNILNVCTSTSQADATLNNSVNITISNLMLAASNQNNNINSSITNIPSLNAQAIKITNPNNGNSRKINLDGSYIPIKIYLAGQKRTIYHGNRKIIDKNN